MSLSVGSVSSYAVELNSCLIAVILANKDAATSLAAKQILELLFVDNVDKFSCLADQMEDYPSDSQFSDLTSVMSCHKKKTNLQGFVKLFLEITSRIETSFSLNILTLLKYKLVSSPVEFSIMLEEEVKLVQCLLKSLFSFSACGSQQSIAQLALECLGIIGPITLKTNFMDTEDYRFPTSDVSCPAVGYIVPIVKELNRMLKSQTGPAACAIFEAVCNLLSSTTEGRNLHLASIDPNLQYLNCLKTKGRVNLKTEAVIQDETMFKEDMDANNLWICPDKNYSDWLKHLIETSLRSMSKSSVLGAIKHVSNLSLKLCELVLPLVVHECFLHSNRDVGLIIASRLANTFKEIAATDDNPVSGSYLPLEIQSKKQKTAALVKAASYIRLQEKPEELISNSDRKTWERSFWIVGLNYLDLAVAAQQCSLSYEALLFTDIWLSQKELETNGRKKNFWKECNAKEVVRIKEIITQASMKIQEQDNSDGIKILLADNSNTNFSTDDLSLLDIQSADSLGQRQNLFACLYDNGLFHILSQYIKSLPQQQALDRNVTEVQAECSWRLGQWDNQLANYDGHNSLNTSVFEAIKSIVRDQQQNVTLLEKDMYATISNSLVLLNLDNVADMNRVMTNLRQVYEIGTLAQSIQEGKLEDTLKTAMERDSLCNSEFVSMEAVYSTRLSILNNLKRAKDQKNERHMDKTRLQLCGRAREAEVFWFCEQILNVQNTVSSYEFRHEKAKVEWSQGKHAKAILSAKCLQQDMESMAANDHESSYNHLAPNVLVSLGEWMDIEKTESSTSILTNYFTRAVEIMKEDPLTHADSILKAHIGLAKLADQHFKKIDVYMESNEFKERKESIVLREKENKVLAEVVANDRSDKALRSSFIAKQRFLDMDQKEILRSEVERNNYLHVAIGSYLTVLQHGDQTLALYRMLSLWFGNQDNVDINKLILNSIPSIPSYRLMPLFYQIAARMSPPTKGKEDSFASVLFQCILKCANEHPHHALPVIFALKNANLDEIIEKNVKEINLKEDDRTKAAHNMVKELIKKTNLNDILEKYAQMTVGMIRVAYLNAAQSKNSAGAIKIPENQYTKIKGQGHIFLTKIRMGPAGIHTFSLSYMSIPIPHIGIYSSFLDNIFRIPMHRQVCFKIRGNLAKILKFLYYPFLAAKCSTKKYSVSLSVCKSIRLRPLAYLPFTQIVFRQPIPEHL